MSIDIKDKGLPKNKLIVDVENTLMGQSINQSMASSVRVNYAAIVGKEVGKNGADFNDINKAIEYVHKLGAGHIFILPGKYVVNENINILPGIHLHGNSSATSYAEQTEIDLNNAYSIQYPFNITNLSLLMADLYNYEKPIGLHNLKISGNGIGTNKVNIGAAKGIHIDNCILWGIKLYFNTSFSINVGNNLFYNSTIEMYNQYTDFVNKSVISENLFDFSVPSTTINHVITSQVDGDIVIEKNTFNHVSYGSLLILNNSPTDITKVGTKIIKDNTFYMVDYSFNTNLTLKAHKTITISNHFNFAGGEPNITMEDCDYCIFSDNYIYDHGYYDTGTYYYGAVCMEMKNVNESVVNGNMFRRSDNSGSWDITIDMFSTCNKNIISNNGFFNEYASIHNYNPNSQQNLISSNISILTNSSSSWQRTNSGWHYLTLYNGWLSYSAGWPYPQWNRDGNVLNLRGMIKGGTTAVGTQVLQLPVWASPTENIIYVSRCSGNNNVELRIGSDGWLTFGDGGAASNVWLSINITYLVK